jgi:hypothetical protein
MDAALWALKVLVKPLLDACVTISHLVYFPALSATPDQVSQLFPAMIW